MFGIGWTELIFIALVLLVFVGPKHLPGMLRKLGQITAELKSASRDLRSQLDIDIGDLQSPSRMLRDLGRDFVESAVDPYTQELASTKKELQDELGEAAEELRDNAKQYAPTPEELKAASETDDAPQSDAGTEDEKSPALETAESRNDTSKEPER